MAVGLPAWFMKEAAPLWALTPKIDKATQAFLKLDMRHGGYSDT